jgi:uncharacterized membrane protein YoaK (UPF0700 family)
MKSSNLAALLSFNGGFVDTAGFLGLQGLFTSHVTGNFVTLAAALVFGTRGVTAKVFALPEFIVVVALASLAGAAFARRRRAVLRPLLVGQLALLIAFFALAVSFGPFPDSDAPAALLTGLAGVAAMAVQNAAQRSQLIGTPPTTVMTSNTVQAVLDAVDLLRAQELDRAGQLHARFGRTLGIILFFAAGCAVSALLYAWIGLWNLAVPVAVGAVSAMGGAEKEQL